MKELATLYSKINYPIDSLRIERVKNAFITKSMLVGSLVSGVNNSSFARNLPPNLKRQFNLVFYGSLIKNKLNFLEEGNYYFVSNLWGSSYHHWLAEVAPKFFLYREELKKGTILFPAEIPNFVKEFLEITGFENYKLFKGNCFVKDLNIITNPNSGHYNAEHLLILRDSLKNSVPRREKQTAQKIYVSRRSTPKRKVVNEEALAKELEKMGFLCLELDEMSFKEQVYLFSNCNYFVSIHGAALTNCIFMPEGSRIIELFPENAPDDELNACYYRLAKVLNHEHEFFWCKREFSNKKFSLHVDNIYVDIEKLKKVLLKKSDLRVPV